MACVCGTYPAVDHRMTVAGDRYMVLCREGSCWGGPEPGSRADAIAAWNAVMSAARAAQEGSDG